MASKEYVLWEERGVTCIYAHGRIYTVSARRRWWLRCRGRRMAPTHEPRNALGLPTLPTTPPTTPPPYPPTWL